VERRWGHRVRRLEQRPSGGWCLFDGDGEQLAEVDWLVLSGSLLAHPRATALLGWTEAPLREVAAGTDDPQLRAAVAGIGAIGWEARSNLLVLLPAPWAGPWRDLPFRLLACDADARMRWGLSRLAVQPLEDGRCALVAHSSADFAAQHGQVFGRGSAIAREIGCGPEAEAAVRTALTSSLQALLAPWLPAELAAAALATSEIRLMRWGAAFPQAPGLDPSLILCPASHLGFCGDYIAGPGFGRLEGAMRSAEALAERLLAGAAEEKGP
jgi:predicted NAD/FAD-dependent oxidoreductase